MDATNQVVDVVNKAETAGASTAQALKTAGGFIAENATVAAVAVADGATFVASSIWDFGRGFWNEMTKD